MKQDRKEVSEHHTGGTDRADAGMPVHRKWPWQKLWTEQSSSSCCLCESWQKAAAVGDQEGTCQLGWEVLHRRVREVQTHQNLRHHQIRATSLKYKHEAEEQTLKVWQWSVPCPRPWAACLPTAVSLLPLLKGSGTGKHKEETSDTWEEEEGVGAPVGQSPTAMVNPGIRKGNSKVRAGTVRLKNLP